MNAVLNPETPKEAARRLAAGPLRDGFKPEPLHRYATADGTLLYWKIRLKHPDGRKWIRPMHDAGNGYELGEPPAPPEGKLLYRLPELAAADPAACVWIVEGEKCADALAKLGMLATTSGGKGSADVADWTPLRARYCIIWPDHDKAGMEYAQAVAERLRALGCTVGARDRTHVAALGGRVAAWPGAHPRTRAVQHRNGCAGTCRVGGNHRTRRRAGRRAPPPCLAHRAETEGLNGPPVGSLARGIGTPLRICESCECSARRASKIRRFADSQRTPHFSNRTPVGGLARRRLAG